MPAPVTTAELVLDAIKARLDLIVGGSNWNTNPAKAIGAPRDALPEGAGERLYLEHVASETIATEAGTKHVERATYNVWCVSADTTNGLRLALRLCRDVQKAIRGGFSAIEVAGANAGVTLGAYARDERAEQLTGATVYSFSLTADWIVDLTT